MFLIHKSFPSYIVKRPYFIPVCLKTYYEFHDFPDSCQIDDGLDKLLILSGEDYEDIHCHCVHSVPIQMVGEIIILVLRVSCHMSHLLKKPSRNIGTLSYTL